MDETLSGVAEFHRVFKCVTRERPEAPELTEEQTEDMGRLATLLTRASQEAFRCAARHGGDATFTRIQLIAEELSELAEALQEEDIVAVLDALTDLTYVVDGSYLTFGLGNLKLPAFREVQRSNMSKLGPDGEPIVNEAGRVVKGPDYSPPNLEPLVASRLDCRGTTDGVHQYDEDDPDAPNECGACGAVQ